MTNPDRPRRIAACVAHSEALNASVPQLAAPRAMEFESSKEEPGGGMGQDGEHSMEIPWIEKMDTWNIYWKYIIIMIIYNHGSTSLRSSPSSLRLYYIRNVDPTMICLLAEPPKL